MLSLAETSPFRRATAPTIASEAGERFGPYVVHQKLGEGGMAYVHRAELLGAGGLRKEVALKRLNTESSEDPDFVGAFVHEAQLASRLHHPNIAQAYDLGKIDHTYFIAMELVSGPTLAEVIAQSRDGAGAVPLPIALEILIQLCDALDHVHDLRDDAGNPLELVHRDVSPMNIIIANTGAAKLIDFGIAKARSTRATTEVGIIKGKHAYVAPEYTYGYLDQRADIFGLGVVAHELLTGRRLFLAETDLETVANVRYMPVPPPSRFRVGISQKLDAIIMTALEREPGLRWQRAGAMRDALVDEARRLGVAIAGPQIRDWVEWAFQQSPRSDSSVDRSLEGQDPSISIEIGVPEREASEVEVPIGAEIGVLEPAAGELETFEADLPIGVEIGVPEQAAGERAADLPIGVEIGVPEQAAGERAEVPIGIEAASRPPERAAVAPRTSRVARPRRAPRWRPPTRWARPQPRRTAAPFVLLSLIAIAAVAVHEGWIDLERWREILAVHLG